MQSDIIERAKAAWNSIADEFNQWDALGLDEQETYVALTDALSDKQAGEVSCIACEGRPRAGNNPCAVCGRSALVDVPAVESEPVAWTSPGQLREIERGANGIVTKYGDEFMSVPLYSDPPRSLSNEGETERTLGELLQLLVAESGAAYCQSLRQFEQIPCLGWERKAKDGAYGEAEHAAHRKANELMGQHQGLARAVKVLRDALSALAATRSGSATTAKGCAE